MQTLCLAASCLSLINGPGITEFQTKGNLLFKTNSSSVVCIRNQSNYNCSPTNNIYNPIDN